MKYLLSAVLLLLLTGLSCKKNKHAEEEKLPAITQTGANTFGCLINGKAWLPAGHEYPTSNYRVNINPRDSNVLIRVYRKTSTIREDLYFNSDTIKAIGTYLITDTTRTRNGFHKSTSNLSTDFCNIRYDVMVQRQGFLKITRYDLSNGIISGEFEVSMVNPDCGYGDTIKITKGRFDKKL